MREWKHRFTGESSNLERAAKRSSEALGKVDEAGQKANTLGSKLTTTVGNLASSFTSKLGPAGGMAESALARITSGAGTAGSALQTGLAGGAVAGAAGLAALAVKGVSSFVSLASEVRNFARASGASAEEASRWVAVADDMGIESEKLSSSLFKLGKTVGADEEALRKHGIELARNEDGTVNLTETMLNVADAFAGTTDPAKRAEIATAAFGKSGKDLIPILEQGREGLKAFFEGAEGDRQILSQEDLDSAREYELALDNLGDAIGGLERGLGKTLVPLLADAANAAAWAARQTEKAKD
ncbi:MAG: hypothetical protein M3394_01470, partial [Actinomycetota bacterium]|nr:hypothetical protein [Actinomycetota bacterium]